ncbi:MAG TPA: Sua5/YciO/YrdC/YwlC family protein, partial [Gammaproteobacteria bacterium]|nr:Sua5/YciO/YrdC/YwlC family protein [Gammaproteobacteria bacterium]
MGALRWPLKRARDVIWGGGVIAYPTEAVFGLGCDPLNARAVARILAIKQRAAAKGFILIAADIAQLEPFMQLDAAM